MDVALALLVLWGLLFVPIGMALHWLVLGEGARARALPLAPVTGIALAMLVLSVLGRLGVDAGVVWVPWVFVVAAVVSGVVVWRRRVVWRTRELIGSTLLLLLAIALVQLPVIGEPGDGPLGYGTPSDPVEEVAAIDAAADGPASDLAVARQAASTREERPIAFEQFAAMWVAVGRDDGERAARDAQWSAYGLHSTITGLLAALVALPLFAFARARGVRWLGLVVLVPLGVLAPYTFLALANGSGAAIAAVPLTAAGVFSLLVTRRDRGWWALAVLFGAAVAACAGPLALLPLVSIGVVWMFVRAETYEHLSQTDTPVSRARTLAVTTAAALLGAASVLPSLVEGGSLLAWPRLHDSLVDTARSWPFAWLDSDLSTAGPRGALETAIWLIGPALLAVAVIYGIVRNERRELAVIGGSIVAALLSLLVAVGDVQASIRLLEYVLLATSPLLAALTVRAVALARENAEEQRANPRHRLAGTGPTLLAFAFVLLSLASTAVTGTRMVHAPALSGVRLESGSALIAAGDPWLAFVVDGERVRGGYADADALSGPDPERASRSITYEGYGKLVLSSSPLSSDPTLRYVENSALDAYQARLFYDRTAPGGAPNDLAVDADRQVQRARSATADRGEGARDAGTVGADVAAATGATETVGIPDRHTPVEPRPVPADRPAGLLLPESEVPGCGVGRNVLESGTCEPDEPVLGAGCTATDLRAVRSPLDRDRPGAAAPERTGGGQDDDAALTALGGTGAAARAAAREAAREDRSTPSETQVLGLEADTQLPRRPPLLGVQCFDVEIGRDSRVLLLHLRDVGLVLAPEDAQRAGGSDAWSVEREADRAGGAGGIGGGTRQVTSSRGASLSYGTGRLFGRFDLVLEGSFGAGVSLGGSFVQIDEDGAEQESTVGLAELRGSANGFSQILRDVQLQGGATVENSAGTDIELGRLFARPRDLPRSCDVPIAIATGEQREVRIESADPELGRPLVRPAITVSVVETTGRGADRTARIAVGSYLARGGLPRHLLVDWTEQFESEVKVEGCDGVVHVEAGAAPDGEEADGQVPLTQDALEAFSAEAGLE